MRTDHMASTSSSRRQPLLESILRGTEHTDSIIILDNVEASGCGLLKTLVSQLSCQSSVHLFLLESCREEWSSLPSTTTQQLTLHDYYTDPLGWHQGAVTQSEGAYSSGRLSDLCLKHCLGVVGGAGGVVMFDSLSPLLLHQPSPVVTRLLHGISHHCRLVVSLVHADLHEDHVINQLCHVTSTSITIQPLTIHTDEPYKCSIQHKRKSGKVAIQLVESGTSYSVSLLHGSALLSMSRPGPQTEAFSVSADYSTLSSSLYESSSHSTPSTHHTPSQPDPTANLTFDLTLTAKEKQDRANVVLPYTRPHISLGKGEGQIFYQPDEADDFDESDPDDDLDI